MRVKPATSELVVRQDEKGRMGVYFKGDFLPGITAIETRARLGYPVEVLVTFHGAAVRFETEE